QEVEFALLRINAAVGENHFDAADILLGDATVGQLGEVAVAQAETNPDRIALVDRGQQAVGAGRDQVAFGLHGAAGGAADRGGDRGPRQVQFGLVQRGLGDGIVRGGVVVFLLADRLGFDQAFQAVHFAAGLLGLGLGVGQRDLVGR